MSSDSAIIQLENPIKNQHSAVHDELIYKVLKTKYNSLIPAIRKRKEFGIEKYGIYLQPHNGRPALIDAYQELLDAPIYLEQAILETDDPLGKLALAQDLVLQAALIIQSELENR